VKAGKPFVLLVTFVFLLLRGHEARATQAQAEPLTSDQKLWGLMQVWAETKFNFVYFDRVPGLDWDEAVRTSIPRVAATRDRLEYYQVLRELVARLNDGHTLVLPPGALTGEYDNPQLELQLVEGRAVVTRVGDTAEIREAALRAGLELVTIGDGVPVWEYFEENVARFYQGGTEQWTKALGLYLLLNGPRGTTVKLGFRDPEGRSRTAELTRDSRNADGSPFVHWLFGHQASLEFRMIGGDLAYFRLPSFGSEDIVKEFARELDRLELDRLRGMIVDVRVNNGGNSDNAYAIISRLIDREIETSSWRTRQYLPARRSWGEGETWYEAKPGRIAPAEGRTYKGPLVVLIGPHTVSAAEDFLVPLDYSNRATLVGRTTAGTTGNPLRVPLPGGGLFQVCTKRDTYPDGKEFVGHGIEPDYRIEPTQLDVWQSRDRALEKAVEILGGDGRRAEPGGRGSSRGSGS
jgi:C-terminal processing protease CtpA/Prc